MPGKGFHFKIFSHNDGAVNANISNFHDIDFFLHLAKFAFYYLILILLTKPLLLLHNFTLWPF